jgi:hypothetical protein
MSGSARDSQQVLDIDARRSTIAKNSADRQQPPEFEVHARR